MLRSCVYHTVCARDRLAEVDAVMTGFRSGSIELLRRLVLVAGLVLSLPSIAAVQLLLERDIDISGQTDLFLVSYAD